jgi:putative membrane protein
MKPLFSSEDLNRITQAVQQAEKKTSGEIVVSIVGRSAAYPEAGWKWAFLSSLSFTLVVFILKQHGLLLLNFWLPLAPLIGSLVGFLISLSPLFQRMFIPQKSIELHVHHRAYKAFVEKEVFKTRERTGILIFLSLFERSVVVLGDSGINAAVNPDQWNGIVALMINSIRSGNATKGMIEAIEQCGNLLEKAKITRRSDDANELPDAPSVCST